MEKHETIEEYINECLNDKNNRDNLDKLRAAVCNICYTDRSFSSGEFDAVVKYIEKQGIKLKDENGCSGALISVSNKSLDDVAFGKAVFYLKKNFCDERIEDVKKIGRSLYGTPEPGAQEKKILEEKTKAETKAFAGGEDRPKPQSRRNGKKGSISAASRKREKKPSKGIIEFFEKMFNGIIEFFEGIFNRIIEFFDGMFKGKKK